MDTCKTCRYWNYDDSGDKDDRRECRRHPPVPFLIEPKYDCSYVVSYNPKMWPTDWCGEFQPKQHFLGVQITHTGEQYIYSDSQPKGAT